MQEVNSACWVIFKLYVVWRWNLINIQKQEGHSDPELLTCSMSTSHILCDPRETHFWPQGHFLNKLDSGLLGDAIIGDPGIVS